MADNNTRAWHAVLTKGSAALKKRLTLKHGDKPEFQQLVKRLGQDKETWYMMHQKKQARLRGETPAATKKKREEMGLKAWGATKGTRMGGEEGGGLTTDAPEKSAKTAAVPGQHRGAGPVKTLSVAEYMKQKEEEQKRAKAKAILSMRAKMNEESDQVEEGLVKKINKKAKNLQLTMKGREKLGDTSKDLSWKQNKNLALQAGRAMKEEAKQMDEISQTTRMNYIDAVRKKHLRHDDDEWGDRVTKPPIGKQRLKMFNKQSQKAFQKALKKEEVEQIDEKSEQESEQARQNKMMKNMRDAVAGAKAKRTGSISEPEPQHKTAQQHNKAIGRALRDTKGDTLGNAHGSGAGKVTKSAQERLKNKIISRNSTGFAQFAREEAEQMDEGALSLRSLVSTDPKKQPFYKTQKGRDAAAKKNIPDLKAAIKSSLGKHPKPNLPEEVEQIDEISKKTLGSYVKKAAPQLATSLMTAATTKDIANAEFHGKRYAKRQKGINKAVDKLAKEEVEQVNELDRKMGGMLDRYINRSTDDLGTKPGREAGVRLALKKKFGNKKYGLDEPKVKAVTREEVEHLDEEAYDVYKDHIAMGYSHREAMAKAHAYDAGNNDRYKAPGRSRSRPSGDSSKSEPHTVHIGGKKWKEFDNYHVANAAAKTIANKSGKSVKVIHPTQGVKSEYNATTKEGLDKVGRETADIDNDKDVDKTDMYLHDRRAAIKKAIIKKKLNEAKTPGSIIGNALMTYAANKKKKAEKVKVKSKPVMKEEKAKKITDKILSTKRGVVNKIDRKPSLDVNLSAHPSSAPTHDGVDDSPRA